MSIRKGDNLIASSYQYINLSDYKKNVEDIAATVGENKIDTDLSNLPTSSKQEITGWGFPSNKYIDLTLNASGSTYTAPADGWIYLSKLGSSGQYIYFVITENLHQIATASFTNQELTLVTPISKKQNLAISYTANGVTSKFRFVYATGTELIQ